MDKYEFRIKAEQIQKLIERKDYRMAVKIADGIEWKRVKNVELLMQVSEAYEKLKRYEDSYELLNMAYDRAPIGRMIVYKMAELATLMGEFDEATELYKEFVKIAPHDLSRYILKYKLYQAKGAPAEDLIAILEEFKGREYHEKWAYELALLYYQEGMTQKCVEECDDLILWFSEGEYVRRAMELKMKLQPLTSSQEQKYRSYVHTEDELALSANGMEDVSPEDVYLGDSEEPEIEIRTVDPEERYNTVNLQAEVAAGLRDLFGEEALASQTYAGDGYTDAGYAQEEYPENGYEEEAYGEPVYEDEGYAEPAYGEPVYEDEGYGEPVYEDGGYGEPVYEDEGYGEPVYEDGGYGEPVYEDEGYVEPAYGEPVYEDEGYGEPVYEEPVYEDEGYVEPVYGDEGYGEPVYEDGGYGEPAYEDGGYETEGYLEEGCYGDEEAVYNGETYGEAGDEEAVYDGETYGEAGDEEAVYDGETYGEAEDEGYGEPVYGDGSYEEAGNGEEFYGEGGYEGELYGEGGYEEELYGEGDDVDGVNEADVEKEGEDAATEESDKARKLYLGQTEDGQLTFDDKENVLDRQITGQMRIEDILAEWEVKKQKMGAELDRIAKEEQERKEEALRRRLEAVDFQSGLIPPDVQELLDEIEGKLPVKIIVEPIEREDPGFLQDEGRNEDEPVYGDEAGMEEEAVYEDEGLYENEAGMEEEAVYEDEGLYENEAGMEEEAVYEDGGAGQEEYEEFQEYEEYDQEESPDTGIGSYKDCEEAAWMDTQDTQGYGQASEGEGTSYEEADLWPEESAEESYGDDGDPEVYEAGDNYGEAEDEEDEEYPQENEEYPQEDEIEEILREAIREEMEAGGDLFPETETSRLTEEEYGEEEDPYQEEYREEEDPYQEEEYREEEDPYQEEASQEGEDQLQEEETAGKGAAKKEKKKEAQESRQKEAQDAPSGKKRKASEMMWDLEKVLEDELKHVSGKRLSDEQEKLFAYFTSVHGMNQQLSQFLEDEENRQLDGTSVAGNIVVTGVSGSGKTTLAVDLVKAIQKLRGVTGSKMARVTGDSMNQRDVAAVVRKLNGGALVIERAGGMTAETAAKLSGAMLRQTGNLFVVLEDEPAEVKKLFTRCESLGAKFERTIEIPVFTNHELVAFGKSYGQEQGYVLDEMAVLALYNRIGNNQTSDHLVNVAEVKDMIDDAIISSSRRGIKRLFSKRRQDEFGNYVLMEKDFEL